MIRSALLVTLGVFVTGCMSVLALLAALVFRNEDRVHRVARLWAKILLTISSTKVEVLGAENILPDQPQVFMSNHLSNFDILVSLAHIPSQFRWIAKKELFRIPVFGPAMRRAGYIEIDRQNHAQALKSLELAAEKIRQGRSVMTFPEGTRSQDGHLKPFKAGTFFLAIQSGAPIIPVTIIGTAAIMPRRSLKVKPGKITMIIDPPIPVRDFSIDDKEELIAKVRNIIAANLARHQGS
jgi:1-acyl-sn-glycerol-3-phosphate acyltransferase